MSKKAPTTAITAMARAENEAALGTSGIVNGLNSSEAAHTHNSVFLFL
jgi:hypothetical protein